MVNSVCLTPPIKKENKAPSLGDRPEKHAEGNKIPRIFLFSCEGTNPPKASKRNPLVSWKPTLACTIGA